MGTGPGETYTDRRDARASRYAGRIAEQYQADYSESGESGDYVVAPWAVPSGAGQHGVLAVGKPLLRASTLPFAVDPLEGRKQLRETQRGMRVTLHLDLAQRGVGGDDSGEALPRDEYRLPRREDAYSFCLRAFDPVAESPVKLGRHAIPKRWKEHKNDGGACKSFCSTVRMSEYDGH